MIEIQYNAGTLFVELEFVHTLKQLIRRDLPSWAAQLQAPVAAFGADCNADYGQIILSFLTQEQRPSLEKRYGAELRFLPSSWDLFDCAEYGQGTDEFSRIASFIDQVHLGDYHELLDVYGETAYWDWAVQVSQEFVRLTARVLLELEPEIRAALQTTEDFWIMVKDHDDGMVEATQRLREAEELLLGA